MRNVTNNFISFGLLSDVNSVCVESEGKEKLRKKKLRHSDSDRRVVQSSSFFRSAVVRQTLRGGCVSDGAHPLG